MTDTPGSFPALEPATVRAQAAALLAAAARHPAADPGAVLHCLAAVSALGAAAGPVPAQIESTDPDRLIERALHLLGSLDIDDFSHPDVLTAARHGRRALLEPRR